MWLKSSRSGIRISRCTLFVAYPKNMKYLPVVPRGSRQVRQREVHAIATYSLKDIQCISSKVSLGCGAVALRLLIPA